MDNSSVSFLKNTNWVYKSKFAYFCYCAESDSYACFGGGAAAAKRTARRGDAGGYSLGDTIPRDLVPLSFAEYAAIKATYW